jgi:hypothetical protein
MAGFFVTREHLQAKLSWWAVQGSNMRPLPCEGVQTPFWGKLSTLKPLHINASVSRCM